MSDSLSIICTNLRWLGHICPWLFDVDKKKPSMDNLHERLSASYSLFSNNPKHNTLA